MPQIDKKWPSLRRTLLMAFAGSALLGYVAGSLLWGWKHGLVALAAILCLALGFWITEMLIGLLTGVKKANPTAVALLFFGKLGWWAGIFLLSQQLQPDWAMAVALGIGTFLLCILGAGLAHYGLPRISDVKE